VIGRLGATPAGGRRLGRWHGWPTVVAHQSWSYTALRTSVFDEVLTYGTATTREDRLAYLRRAADDGGCWQPGGGSTKTRIRRGRPTMPSQ
jgi:hypothetical protein